MCFIFSTVFLFTKVGLNIGWTPFLFSGIRFISAGLIIIIIMMLKRKKLNRDIWRKQPDILKIGVFMTGIPFAAVYWSIQYLDSGIVSILVTLGTFFTFILEKIKSKNEFEFTEILGILFCICGTMLIAVPDFHKINKFNIIIIVIFIVAEFFFAIGSIEVKNLLTKSKLNAFSVNGFQMFYGGAFLLGINIILKEKPIEELSLYSFAILLYFIFIASILANSIYCWLIEKKGAFFPATQTFVSPVLAIFLGALFLNEEIILIKIIASILILIGLMMMYSNSFKTILNRRDN